MGVSSYLPTPDNMKCFVILSLAACSFAAPAADADAQYLAYGHGLVGGVYASAPAVATIAQAATYAAHGLAIAAPVAYHHAIAAPLAVAAPAVAEVKTVEVKAAPAVVPAAYHIAAPAAYHVAAPA